MYRLRAAVAATALGASVLLTTTPAHAACGVPLVAATPGASGQCSEHAGSIKITVVTGRVGVEIFCNGTSAGVTWAYPGVTTGVFAPCYATLVLTSEANPTTAYGVLD